LKYEVADHLPPDAILALKLTHPLLNSTLALTPRPRATPLSNCARLAMRTYLSKPLSNPTHMRCVLCKALYPIAMFNSSFSPACVPQPFPEFGGPQPAVVELPQRFCAWHVGRLAKIVRTDKGGRNEWVSRMADMCMHCGIVRGWGECNCRCDSCGTRRVRTYIRYLDNGIECRRFRFWRQQDRTTAESKAKDPAYVTGRLYVREHCWNPGMWMSLDPG
jgi:hypothetical protein